MTFEFTKMPSMNGDEPTELLKPLAFEYLAEMNRRGLIQLLETVGSEGQYVLLAIIPNAKVDENKIVETMEKVPTQPTTVGKEEKA